MKDRKITIRMTESEYEKMKAMLVYEGYMSMSKFIRDKVFNIQRPASKKSIYSHKFSNDIAALTKQVKKIGVNYNQVVKRFNALPTTTKSDEPVKLMSQLYELTKHLITHVQQLKEQIIAHGDKAS